jgi:peptide/nickel transport system substrate-binding protein
MILHAYSSGCDRTGEVHASEKKALIMMRIRPAALAMAAAAVVALGAGCSSTTTSPGAGAGASAGAVSSGGTVTIPLLREGASTDFSNLSDEYADNYITANWSEHLMKIGPGGQLQPWLAQSVTQQSPTVYVYHLRHGVTFWDGDAMTSADVAGSMEFYSKPGTYLAAHYTDMKSVTASGPFTVVVTLKQPDAAWAYTAAIGGGIFEQKFQQEHGSAMGKPGVGVMATGPYEIKSFDPTTGLELTANPHYWGGAVPVRQISVKFFATDTSMALAYRAGEIDLAFPQSAQQFESPCGCHVLSAGTNSSAGISMNVNIPPWNDIHVRRAVAYAIDRPAEIAASGDPSSPDYTVLAPTELQELGSPAQVNALVNALPNYPYNLAAAKAELAKSPYPNGFTATTYTLEFGVYTPETEVVAAQLAKIGIKLTVKELTFTGWIAKWSGPRTTGFWVVTNMTGTGPDPNSDARWMLTEGSGTDSGGADLAGYSSPAVTQLVNEADSTQDKATRLALYGQALKIVASDVPYVMLYTHSSDLALAARFSWPGFNEYFYTSPWALGIRPS